MTRNSVQQQAADYAKKLGVKLETKPKPYLEVQPSNMRNPQTGEEQFYWALYSKSGTPIATSVGYARSIDEAQAMSKAAASAMKKVFITGKASTIIENQDEKIEELEAEINRLTMELRVYEDSTVNEDA